MHLRGCLIFHDYLLRSPFLYGLYTLHVCAGTAAPRTDLKQGMAVFKLASVILQPLKNPGGHTLQGLKERDKEKQNKKPSDYERVETSAPLSLPFICSKPSLQGLSW